MYIAVATIHVVVAVALNEAEAHGESLAETIPVPFGHRHHSGTRRTNTLRSLALDEDQGKVYEEELLGNAAGLRRSPSVSPIPLSAEMHEKVLQAHLDMQPYPEGVERAPAKYGEEDEMVTETGRFRRNRRSIHAATSFGGALHRLDDLKRVSARRRSTRFGAETPNNAGTLSNTAGRTHVEELDTAAGLAAIVAKSQAGVAGARGYRTDLGCRSKSNVNGYVFNQSNATFSFLRIPRTGSKLWADMILPKLCQCVDANCSGAHVPIESITLSQTSGAAGKVHLSYTWLRDPVEQTMSTYAYLKRSPVLTTILGDKTWGVPEKDRRYVASAIQQGFSQYADKLGDKMRNRQARYLLGETGSYDWDTDGDALLEKAKDNLKLLTAFGITDCYRKSVKAIARELGLDVELASDVFMVGSMHRHINSTRTGTPSEAKLRQDALASSERGNEEMSLTGPQGDWTRMITKTLRAEVLKLNNVDVPLYKYARKLFAQNNHVTC